MSDLLSTISDLLLQAASFIRFIPSLLKQLIAKIAVNYTSLILLLVSAGLGYLIVKKILKPAVLMIIISAIIYLTLVYA